MPKPKTSKMQNPRAVRDLVIVGDFIRYFLYLFIPFAIIGGTYALFAGGFLMGFLVNPLVYAGGIAIIIILIKYDLDDIMILVGRAGKNKLALHIKYSQTIQKISLLMSSRKYKAALKAVNELLEQEPKYPNALNLKGQILLEGFGQYEAARAHFEKVMSLTDSDSEDYKLAEELAAATYGEEQE